MFIRAVISVVVGITAGLVVGAVVAESMLPVVISAEALVATTGGVAAVVGTAVLAGLSWRRLR